MSPVRQRNASSNHKDLKLEHEVQVRYYYNYPPPLSFFFKINVLFKTDFYCWRCCYII